MRSCAVAVLEHAFDLQGARLEHGSMRAQLSFSVRGSAVPPRSSGEARVAVVDTPVQGRLPVESWVFHLREEPLRGVAGAVGWSCASPECAPVAVAEFFVRFSSASPPSSVERGVSSAVSQLKPVSPRVPGSPSYPFLHRAVSPETCARGHGRRS